MVAGRCRAAGGRGDRHPAGPALASALLERHGVLTREAVRGEGVAGRLRRRLPGAAGHGGVGPASGGATSSPAWAAPSSPCPAPSTASGPTSATAPTACSCWPPPTRPTPTACRCPGRSGRERRQGQSGRERRQAPAAAPAGWPAPTSSSSTVPPPLRRAGGQGPHRPPGLDGTWEEQAVGALDALVSSGRARRLRIERYHDELGPVLRAAGFVPSPKGLVRYG